MTNPLAQDLGGVVRLLEKATPGPWAAEQYSEDDEGCGVIAVNPEIGMRSPTRGQVAWFTTVAGASFESPGRAQTNADLVAAMMNFFVTHSAEIAGALLDAERWRPIESAPRDGSEIWAYNGEQARMHWIQGEGYALWAWSDELLADADPNPEQPTHWRPIPAPPTQDSAMQQGGGGGEAAA